MQCTLSGEREQSIDAERLFEIFHRAVRPMVVRGNGFGHTHTDSYKDVYVFFSISVGRTLTLLPKVFVRFQSIKSKNSIKSAA